jgi:hypothetical protein
MDVRLAVLADYASISREGKLNIMGVFGEINPPVMPFQLPTMFVVAAFQASPAEVGQEKVLRVALLDSDGKELLALEQSMVVPPSRLPGSPTDLQAIFCLNGIPFQRAGTYAFHFLVGGETKTTVPLRVNEPQSGAA